MGARGRRAVRTAKPPGDHAAGPRAGRVLIRAATGVLAAFAELRESAAPATSIQRRRTVSRSTFRSGAAVWVSSRVRVSRRAGLRRWSTQDLGYRRAAQGRRVRRYRTRGLGAHGAGNAAQELGRLFLTGGAGRTPTKPHRAGPRSASRPSRYKERFVDEWARQDSSLRRRGCESFSSVRPGVAISARTPWGACLLSAHQIRSPSRSTPSTNSRRRGVQAEISRCRACGTPALFTMNPT